MIADRKSRSPINALKILNSLRAEKGEKPISLKPKIIKVNAQIKEIITKLVIQEQFPELLKSEAIFTEGQRLDILREFERKVKLYQEGKLKIDIPVIVKTESKKPVTETKPKAVTVKKPVNKK